LVTDSWKIGKITAARKKILEERPGNARAFNGSMTDTSRKRGTATQGRMTGLRSNTGTWDKNLFALAAYSSGMLDIV